MKKVCVGAFQLEKNGYSVTFPDVEGVITQGENLFEAMTNAETALSEMLVAYENSQVGKAEKMTNRIKLYEDVPELPNILVSGLFYFMIKADTEKYRENPSSEIELWYNPETKKYFTVFTDENIEVKPTAGKYLREVAGI